MSRYTKKGDPLFINTSMNLSKDVHDLMIKYKDDNRLRNKSLTVEILLAKALKAEGYKIE